MKTKKKKKPIITLKKINKMKIIIINFKKKEKDNVVDSYKEFWYIYIYIYIYILNVINVEIIKLMEIYTVF